MSNNSKVLPLVPSGPKSVLSFDDLLGDVFGDRITDEMLLRSINHRMIAELFTREIDRFAGPEFSPPTAKKASVVVDMILDREFLNSFSFETLKFNERRPKNFGIVSRHTRIFRLGNTASLCFEFSEKIEFLVDDSFEVVSHKHSEQGTFLKMTFNGSTTPTARVDQVVNELSHTAHRRILQKLEKKVLASAIKSNRPGHFAGYVCSQLKTGESLKSILEYFE